ncbi:hypothetical protein ANN_16551 [Periplaneta americana]|uniref:Uncharacterized protein n=1 Tax=Periplaneta americana TaxID=6978 RepID=A0ABQ8SS24_PERAM|nr:hypothetical protein ANN_16551 [Periplaneta americana]
MAVDIGHTRQHMCLTWSQATKGNIEGGGFGPVLWIEFGVAQWSERLVRRTKDPEIKVFENKVLRKVFGTKRDEVTGEWRKLHNAELHALYSSPDIIRNIKSRRLRWAGHVARMGESRNAYRVLVGRPEGKIPLGRSRRRWEDNIRMDLRVESEVTWVVPLPRGISRDLGGWVVRHRSLAILIGQTLRIELVPFVHKYQFEGRKRAFNIE